MVVHEKPVGGTVEWYTPPILFAALRLSFDLDPASPGATVVPWIPATRHITFDEDGLAEPWHGRVWLNPPYGPDLPAWVDKMCEHGNGVMLTASRTETRWWQQAATSADVVVLLRERLHFIRGDGHQARSSHASTLFAWGNDSAAAVWGANLGWRAARKTQPWMRAA